MYQRPSESRELREVGRVILAHGEVTGHAHEVVTVDAPDVPCPLDAAQYFEEPDGRRVLLALMPVVLRHQEHAPITLDPTQPVQARQGDVLLIPLGPGAWEVRRQREYDAGEARRVAD